MRLVSADFEYSSYHPWALEECKSISITNTLPRHIFFQYLRHAVVVVVVDFDVASRVALWNENCSESLGMEKSEIFCSRPEKCSPAKLESSSQDDSLSLSLPFSARTLTGLPLSLHFHSIVVAPSLSLADTDSGSLGIAKGALFSFVELFRSLGFYCLGNYLPPFPKPRLQTPRAELSWQPTDIPESRLGVAKTGPWKYEQNIQLLPRSAMGQCTIILSNKKSAESRWRWEL